MANPFAMTEEEERLNAMYGQSPGPYATYMEPEDQFMKFVKSQQAMRDAERVPAEVAGPPAAPQPLPTEQPESPEQKLLQQKMQAAFENSRSNLQSGVDQLQKEYDKYGDAEPERDWGGLIAGLDYFGGSNNLAGYKRPVTKEEIAQKKMAIGQMLQKAKEGVSDADLARIKYAYDDSKRKSDDGRMDRYMRTQDIKLMDGMRDDLEKEIFQTGKQGGFSETETGFAQMDTALDGGDYQSFVTMLGAYARGPGAQKGVLTDKDLQMVAPENIQRDIAKWQQYFSKNPGKTRLPPELIKPYQDILVKYKKNISDNRRNELNRLKPYFEQNPYYSSYMKKGGVGHELFGRAEKRISDFGGGKQVAVSPKATAPISAGETVDVIHPDGTPGTINKKDLNDALMEGYKLDSGGK